MQKRSLWAICIMMLGVLTAGIPLWGQSEGTSQTPMYTYLSGWGVPRAQWVDMAKRTKEDVVLEDKLVADGTITGYGHYVNLIHTGEGTTHGEWFTTTTEGNVVKALSPFYASPTATSPVLADSKHWDRFLVSRVHGSRSGTFEGAILSGSEWQLKPGQMQAFEAIVKARLVPILKKGLEDGTVISYSMDTEDYHSDAPGLVDFVFIVTNADALDKVNAAFEASFDKDTEIGPALDTLTKRKSHRDFLDLVTHMVIK
jgi:hypothetical protein